MTIELLERFLQGRCSEEEARRVKALLDKDPGILEAYLREAAEEAQAADLVKGGEGDEVSSGVMGERMPVEMERGLLAGFREKRKASVVRRKIWWPAAAAAVVIGLVVTGWLSGAFRESHAYALLEATTSVKQVQLADGSKIWLRPGSKVRVDETLFGKKERLIELEQGEAFFDVVHNASCPFIVKTGKVQTADIGTSFDITKTQEGVVVTVATGEVKVSLADKALGHVLPGSQVDVAVARGGFTTRVLPVWMASVWKENIIQLKNASFGELAMAMQQLYNIQLKATEERINRQTYTIQLSRQTPGEQVIRVVCLFNQNQYRKKADGSYLIY